MIEKLDTCDFCGVGEDAELLFRSPDGKDFLACQPRLSKPGVMKKMKRKGEISTVDLVNAGAMEDDRSLCDLCGVRQHKMLCLDTWRLGGSYLTICLPCLKRGLAMLERIK